MATQTYLIALGGNRARSCRIIATHVTPAKAGAYTLRDIESCSRDEIVWGPAFAGVTVVAASRISTSKPLGPGKRRYANAVAIVESDLGPPEMLSLLKSIERAHGRRPGRRWGDRVLDLDIIGWSGGIWASRELGIPHAAFRDRRFVLLPLVEVAPGWHDPVTGLTARQLLARLDRKDRRA